MHTDTLTFTSDGRGTDADAEATGAEAAGAGRPSILVVDDNDAGRDVLCRCLTRGGYVPTPAADGPEALRLLSERAFDLVVLDVMMPGMSGLEVLERLRRDRPPADLPVIMATAKGRSEDVVEALGLGANDYVTKPLDFRVVMARVGTQVSLGQSVRADPPISSAASASVTRSWRRPTPSSSARPSGRRAELEMAAKIQKALLPAALPDTPGLRFAWACRPCQELAGDSLNVCRFPDGRVGAYVLDVSGHGVAASLLAVAATRLLTADGPDSVLLDRDPDGPKRPADPAAVAARLDERFRWDDSVGQFITIFYAVVDAPAHELTYVSAGHPGAVRVGREPGAAATVLDQSGMPIGLGEVHQQHRVRLAAGDRVYLYSDGVLESLNDRDEQFGINRLITLLEGQRNATLDQSVAALLDAVRDWTCGRPARDDVSVLACECE